MKELILWTSLLLILFCGLALAQDMDNMGPRCQNLAHEFADNPNSLNEMQLKQLQFCVTQTIEQRYKTNPPELLRGTIIEPPSSPVEVPGTTPPAPPQHPSVQ